MLTLCQVSPCCPCVRCPHADPCVRCGGGLVLVDSRWSVLVEGPELFDRTLLSVVISGGSGSPATDSMEGLSPAGCRGEAEPTPVSFWAVSCWFFVATITCKIMGHIVS
ncbi:uncharacterized protein LOC143296893 [Babylonia areolata]|uniref:uncharacterized protein LOC143296893 n=1 Tax=Babylonia areolata TaxID=304850 RepID=UPI003FD17D8A